MKRFIYTVTLIALLAFIVGGLGFDSPPQASSNGNLRVGEVEKHPKLDSALSQLIASQKGAAKLSHNARQFGISPVEGKVRVVIETKPDKSDEVVELTKGLGGEVEAVHRNLVQAWVPISVVKELAGSPKVKFIRRPFRPRSTDIISQGVELIGASQWQEKVGLSGEGVKIAILDIGFKDYYSLLASELPTSVITKSFRADGNIEADEPHGTACAEIVHDLAPEAELYLVNFGTGVEWGMAVGWLVGEGVNIISHSMGWFAGPGDGTGSFSEAVDRARDNGILWVNATGNEAHRHWSGSWQDSDGDGRLNFTLGDNNNTITVDSENAVSIFLRWDDPWGASSNDFDLYLLDQGLSVVARSEDCQSGSQHPREWIYYQAPPGEYHIAIKRCKGSEEVNFDLFIGNPQTLEYKRAPRSLMSPAGSKSALAVGAICWENPDELEDFSSQGPTRDERIKPDLVAPDGVKAFTYGSFPGTSAATPHVAGAAALIKQLHPAFTPGQIQNLLQEKAIDLGKLSKDNLFGWGRLDVSGEMSKVEGEIKLQGRKDHSGARVTLGGLQETTNEDGGFAFSNVPSGSYRLKASMAGYLFHQGEVKVKEEKITLPSITLFGGDANHDGDVDAADLSKIAADFNTHSQASDINDDGIIDISDLVLAGVNYGRK